MESRHEGKGLLAMLSMLLLACVVLWPMNLSAQQGSVDGPIKIEIKNKLVSVDLRDADLIGVLKEIEQKTGVKMVTDKSISGKKVTAQFKDCEIEKALKTLLKQDYVFVFQKEPGAEDKFTLKEVLAGRESIGSRQAAAKMRTIEISYGAGKEQVGAENGGEGAHIGPRSFAVDDAGNIYVLDTLNNRIQIFSVRGEYLATIALKEGTFFAEDIAVDSRGNIYVYDGLNKLYRYDRNGRFLGSVEVDTRRWRTRGHMHISGNHLYMSASDSNGRSGNFLIGEIADASFKLVEEEISKTPASVYGQSGKGYKFENYVQHQSIDLEIMDREGRTLRTIPLTSEGLIAVKFLKEDGKNNFYIRIDSQDQAYKLHAYIHKFNASGDYIDTFHMPSSSIHYWAAKINEVQKDGIIYDFLPEKDKLRIHVFTTEQL